MTDMLAPSVSALSSVPQERRIVTDIPGPKSLALHARRNAVMDALWDIGARAILVTEIHACRL